MAFQPAATNAIESLVAPRAAAANATGGGDSSGLFQSLVADATSPIGEPPVSGIPSTVSTPIAPANTSGAFALLLQTGDAPTPATPDSSQAAPFAQTAFTPGAAEPAPVAIVSPSTALPVDPANIEAVAVVQTPPTTAAVPAESEASVAQTKPDGGSPTTSPATPPLTTTVAATPIVTSAMPQAAEPAETGETPLASVALPDDQVAAPAQIVPPAIDAAQAIVFAPFATAPAQPVVKATTGKSGDTINTEQPDAAPKSDLFKKTAFSASPAKGNAANTSAFVVRVAPDAPPAAQSLQQQRPDSSLPGSASPISGFEAPRAAADAISTPVARAPHGAAAAMQVAQSITRNFQGKSSNFEVRLDPAELGRVDVKISVDHDKRVTASVSADNPQTLTDLRGAARDIERALNEAGLDLAQGGLSFEMNQRQANGDEFDAAPYAAGEEDVASGETIATAAKPFGMERWSNAGVDVWA